MLAVHVLGCTGTTEERACLLHKIIQIAAELKSPMGNMFGFAAVMRALELPQVNTQGTELWLAVIVEIVEAIKQLGQQGMCSKGSSGEIKLGYR